MEPNLAAHPPAPLSARRALPWGLLPMAALLTTPLLAAGGCDVDASLGAQADASPVVGLDAWVDRLDGGIADLADASAEDVGQGDMSREDMGPADTGPADMGPVRPTYDFAPFDAALDAFLAENGLDGATATVVHRDWGVLHEQSYGSFDLDRVIMLASSSKVVSAGVMMRLHEEGLIDLDAPLRDAVGDRWGNARGRMSVAQLISNSSGLVGLLDNALYPFYLCQFLGVGSVESCARTIYFAPDRLDIVPPDTQFHYGGGQWHLAGGIAEAVTGKPWRQLVQEIYTEPCGLSLLDYANPYAQSTLVNGTSGPTSYPSFVNGDESNILPTTNPNIEGGAYTRVRDYAQLLLMHLRGGVCPGGRVLSEASVLRMREDRIWNVYRGSTHEPLARGYGFGWWVHRDLPGVFSDAGSFGATPWIDTQRGYAVIILVEADPDAAPDLFRAMYPVTADVIDSAQ